MTAGNTAVRAMGAVIDKKKNMNIMSSNNVSEEDDLGNNNN